MNEEQLKQMVNSPMFQNMMGDEADNIKGMIDKDPSMIKQLSGFWKQLDEMASSDKKGYEEFIQKQKKEFEVEQEKKQKELEKLRIITSKPLCSLKIRVSKIVVQKKDTNVSETIKLFDFNKNAEISKSFIENEDQSDKPLDQPKIYLNIVHHDKVLPPLKQNREFADPKNDKEW